MASPRKRRERKAAKLAAEQASRVAAAEAKQRTEDAAKAAQLVAEALEQARIEQAQALESATLIVEGDFADPEETVQIVMDPDPPAPKRRRISRKKTSSKTK